MLRIAHKVHKTRPNLSRVDLHATVIMNPKVKNRFRPAQILLEIYIVQKVSNGVQESIGKISNVIREGARSRMGLMVLEANLRLHFTPPLERARSWFEQIRKLWIRCGGQNATCQSGKKRNQRIETINPVGNERAKAFSSKSMAQKRRLASRLGPLLGLEHRPIIVENLEDESI